MNRNIVKFYAILFIMLSSVVLITDCCSSRSMPKSRPRPVSHFRGVITTSSAKITTTNGNGDSTTFTLITTKTTSTTVSESQSETTSTVTDPRSGPGPGPGGGGGGTRTGSATTTTTTNSGNAHNNNKDQLMRMGKCSLLFEENYCLNGGKCYNFTIANSTMPTCECADGFMGERCESKYLDGTYLSMRKSKIHIETASIYYGAFLALIMVLILLYCLHYNQSAAAAASSSVGAGSSTTKLLRKSKKVVS
ncbi:protein spitz-like [Wyeomyia smithii]|uniref:protein spitz-like n=1 Tax=Wyeomyia smithii TaxID=174621 RepID=UPI002467C40D|nr:protein spitz-like [Wyeomyia smithii]